MRYSKGSDREASMAEWRFVVDAKNCVFVLG